MPHPFFQTFSLPVNQMNGSYELSLIILSYIIAVFSSYIALDITGHLRDPHSSRFSTRLWILGGAFSMGAGIWSMHFIGMLSFRLPIDHTGYDPFWTGLSLGVAILASSFALILLAKKTMHLKHIVGGGVILGLAIASMHYTGMQAMKIHLNISYRPSLFILSVVIAILASEAAIWLALKSNEIAEERRYALKIGSALIMGAAICGMHYTGMAAAVFTPKESNLIHSHPFDHVILALVVAILTVMLMSIALFSSIYRVLAKKNRLLSETTFLIKNILESSVEYSIIALDLRGLILTWNEGAIHNYGYQPDEMIGKETIYKLGLPLSTEAIELQMLLDTALKKGIAEGELQRQRKDGGIFTADIVINLRKNASGNPIGYLLISKNITEKNRLLALELENKQIQESNRLKSQFLANMSHELRTPLNAVIGFSELLYYEKMGPLNQEQKECMNDVIVSGKHLLSIINDILDLARIESGKLEFHPKKINVKALLEEVFNHFLPTCSEKKINLTDDIHRDMKEVHLDPTRLKQIFYNLISNSVKFSSNLGTVKVQIKARDDKTFCIIVEDNGIGMTGDEIKKIFIRFNQLDSSLNKKYQGAGLGLTVTKQLVDAQNGSISVQSQKGKGSQFAVILPYSYP